jgi:hypothetical protein
VPRALRAHQHQRTQHRAPGTRHFLQSPTSNL